LKGKVEYMAPEQATGEALDARTDEWALAAVLYHLLTGRAPYGAETQVAVLHRIFAGGPPDSLPNDVPEQVRTIVSRALSKRPADRYPNVLELQRAIEKVMTTLGYSVTTHDVAEFYAAHLSDSITRRRGAVDNAVSAAVDRKVALPSLVRPASQSSSSDVLGRLANAPGTPSNELSMNEATLDAFAPPPRIAPQLSIAKDQVPATEHSNLTLSALESRRRSEPAGAPRRSRSIFIPIAAALGGAAIVALFMRTTGPASSKALGAAAASSVSGSSIVLSNAAISIPTPTSIPIPTSIASSNSIDAGVVARALSTTRKAAPASRKVTHAPSVKPGEVDDGI
jgi:serine/threonine protein kinase